MNGPPNQKPATALHLLAAVAMQVAVWLLLVYLFHARHHWYGFFDVSDITVYRQFADLFARGLRPYCDVAFEYPPLAAPLMILPGKLSALGDYDWVFAVEMMVACTAAAVVATAAALRLWPGDRGPLLTSGAFALAVLLAGPIVANRFDAVVALDMAIFAYCMARRWWWVAACALGIGFALKLTPAMFLPLVLLLAARRRKVIFAAIAFVVAGFVPFVPHLLRGGRGLANIFTYHARRPLQIESLLASPYLLGHTLDLVSVQVRNTFGSQSLAGPGTRAVAAISPWLLGVCLAALHALLWRRRQYLRDHPSDVPLVLLGMVLVLVCTSKVLSPQFLVWTFPLVGLAAAGRGRRRLAIGILLLGATLLTQIGFPSRYWDLVALNRNPIVLLVLRNLGLLAVTVLTIHQIFRLGRPQADRARPAESAPGSCEADGPVR